MVNRDILQYGEEIANEITAMCVKSVTSSKLDQKCAALQWVCSLDSVLASILAGLSGLPDDVSQQRQRAYLHDSHALTEKHFPEVDVPGFELIDETKPGERN